MAFIAMFSDILKLREEQEKEVIVLELRQYPRVENAKTVE